MTDSYMKRVRRYQILNTIGLIITILVNGLANSIPLNGVTTGEVSDTYLNLFAPAGITFAIWGVIYIGLILFIFYQLGFLSKGKKQYLDLVFRIRWSFIIASGANTLWIFAWHYDQILISMLLIILLLFSLIDIYKKVYEKEPKSAVEKVTVQWVFSVYLSWISVATIANITTFLVSIRWNGLGIPPQIWTIVVILVATMITLKLVFNKRDIAYAFVSLWAFVGIIIKHITFFEVTYKGIIAVTIFAMLLIIISIWSKPKGYQTQKS